MLALLAWAAGVRAERVILTDGRTLEADAVRETDDEVLLTVNGTLVRMPRARVRQIVRGGSAPAAAPVEPSRKRKGNDSERQLGELVSPPLPEAGKLLQKNTPQGDYLRYLPRMLRRPIRVVYLFHGTPNPGETAVHAARELVERPAWIAFAEAEGVVLCSVAFDDARFLGARYLYGQPVMADDFLLGLHKQLGRELEGLEPRFMLYGHSAGAQFALRFALVHPQCVSAVVASAPGSYAYPDAKLVWPFGMEGAPNPKGFEQVATLPITVLVGRQDLEPFSEREPQHGINRVLRAENWVREMRELATRKGLEPQVQLVKLEGLNHTSYFLAPEALQYLGR